jgi:hypothetical protein
MSESNIEFDSTSKEILPLNVNDPGLGPPFDRPCAVGFLNLIPGASYSLNFGMDCDLDDLLQVKSNSKVLEQVHINTRSGIKPIPSSSNMEAEIKFEPKHGPLVTYLVSKAALKAGFNVPNHNGQILEEHARLTNRNRPQKPEWTEMRSEHVWRHYCYAFHTSHYIASSTLKTLKKLYRPRLPDDQYSIKRVNENMVILLSQLGFYGSPKEQRKEPPKNMFDFVHLLMNSNITLDKSAGITVPQVISGHLHTSKRYVDYDGPRNFNYMIGNDGIARCVSGDKGHLLNATIYYLKWLLENHSLEELNPANLWLICPQIYNAVEKLESRKGYEDVTSCRIIFVGPLLMYVLEHPFYYPFGQFVKKNLPFFHGSDWSAGAANDIMEVISLPVTIFHKKALEMGLISEKEVGVDANCWDIRSQDTSYGADLLANFQKLTIGLFQVEAMDRLSPYSKDEIIAAVRAGDLETVKSTLRYFVYETPNSSEDEFQLGLESMLYYCMNCNATPTANWSTVRAIMKFYRQEMSGSQMTSSNNTAECSLVPIDASRRLVEVTKPDARMHKLAKLFALILIKHTNHVAMGDNGFNLWPSVFRQHLFKLKAPDSRPKEPLMNSLFNDSLNYLGAEVKPSESFVVWDWKPRIFHPDCEPLEIADGYGDVPAFCQRRFFLASSEKYHQRTLAFSLNIDAIFVPWRFPADYFSKISPFAHHNSLVVYYVKVCSLIRDNAGVDLRTHRMLTLLAKYLRATLMSRSKSFLDDLVVFLNNMSSDELMTFIQRNTDRWDISKEEASKMIPLVGEIPTLSQLHKNLFRRDKKIHEINFLRKFDNDFHVVPKRLEVDFDTYHLFKDLAVSAGLSDKKFDEKVVMKK